MLSVLVVGADEVGLALMAADDPVSLRRHLAGSCHPDVVVLDVRGGDGPALTAAVCDALPRTAVLVLVPADDGELGTSCLRAGALGAASVDDVRDGLFGALEQLGDGHAVLGRETADAVVAALRHSSAGPDRLPLTAMQERILSLMATGATNRTIAARLGLAEKTVKNYATGIYSALGASNRTQAVALWSRLRALD